MSATSSKSSIHSFAEKGFGLQESLIDIESLQTMKRYLESRVPAALSELSSVMTGAVTLDALKELCGDSDRFGALSKNHQNIATGHFDLETRLSKELVQFVMSQKRLQDFMRELLGSQKIYMHMPPMARFIFADFLHAGVPAHQDYSYNEHMDDFATVWIPMNEINASCGGVNFYEGSHSKEHRLNNRLRDVWLEALPTDGYKKVHHDMQLGDILIFSPWVIHESASNLSDHTRYSLDCRFFGENCSSSKHYLDLQTGKIMEPSGK